MRDQDGMDKTRTAHGWVGCSDVADDPLKELAVHAHSRSASSPPPVSQLRRLAIYVGGAARRTGKKGSRIGSAAPSQIEDTSGVGPVDPKPAWISQQGRRMHDLPIAGLRGE